MDLLIPEEKRAAVTRGLQEAFGATACDGIRQVFKKGGGMDTTPVFRIMVAGSAYLLRIILRSDSAERHYQNIRVAAEAGVAPRVWYTNVEDKVSIIDYVEAVPFPIADARRLLPAALRTLHALPPFAPVPDPINTSPVYLINKGAGLDAFITSFRVSNVVPECEADEVFARHGQIVDRYPRLASDMVSSHNDLKPENILFDGDRAWLVDWEASFLNDRYSDLAVLANYLVADVAEEQAYLETYFGQPAGEDHRARFFLMQQLSHLFYAMAYLLLAKVRGAVDHGDPLPAFSDYLQRNWAGDVDLANHDSKLIYGKVHWARLLQNMRQPRFEEALRIVSERHSV